MCSQFFIPDTTQLKKNNITSKYTVRSHQLILHFTGEAYWPFWLRWPKQQQIHYNICPIEWDSLLYSCGSHPGGFLKTLKGLAVVPEQSWVVALPDGVWVWLARSAVGSCCLFFFIYVCNSCILFSFCWFYYTLLRTTLESGGAYVE